MFFKITFEIGTPYFQKVFEECREINTVIVDTFLYVLSKVPDTLIQRKAGKKEALKVSESAKKIIKDGGLRQNLSQILQFDKELTKKGGILNPGTTADLTAAILLVNLLLGLKI